MGELNLVDLILAGMATCGPLIFGLALLLSPLGIPAPSGILVLAAGALVRQGLLDLPLAASAGLAGVVLSDAGAYGVGRFAGDRIQRLLDGKRSALWRQVRARFLKHGALALLFTRILFTSLGVPANLVAGSSRYPFHHFLAWDLAGRLGWLLLYGGLGYALGGQWPVVSRAISDYQGWLLGLTGLVAGVLLLRWLFQNRTLNQNVRSETGSLKQQPEGNPVA